ncbi:hypothetical protein HW932_12635 [Allochromatium humboldtianum]|uniref:Uncharacterized protein n=1 Tax=Allochromatium humboldtianum TaxID=504901 RepID=A0A850RFF3_9GAMM|nr:hypothetical protein [Allochromatium humboldtianum]NVZ10107.1 hypothetical protein [Allochromatium humboldtianum]
MLTETLQRLERLDGMDSTLFGRELLSFGRLLLDRGWIAGIGYFSRIDVEVMDDIFEEVEVTVDEAAGRYTYPHPLRRKVILSGSLMDVTRYRFQREPFFDHLSTLLGIEPRFAGRRRCLVEHHLWYLGDLRVGNRHAFAPMFFGRRLKDTSADQITTALSDPAFGTGGVVLAQADPKLALPNGHQVRAVKDLLIVEDGEEQFDLQVLERILVGLPADPADEPEEWFDAKTGGLRLQHLPETVYFSGIQSQIVEFFWKSRHGAPLSWAEVKRRTFTASKGIDDAFKGRDWSQWIERVGHGKLRLRTSRSA